MLTRRLRWDSPQRRNSLLVQQARCDLGDRVLELSLYGRVGHGTEPLSVMLKRAYPGATIVALYNDRNLLEAARQTAVASGVEVELHEGTPLAPPFAAESFDRLVSSLLFHHLTTDEKRRVFTKAYELLKPGGELYIVDWGEAHNVFLRIAFLAVQISDGLARTADNIAGRLVGLIQEAGFVSVQETFREIALPGTLAFYRATKPSNKPFHPTAATRRFRMSV